MSDVRLDYFWNQNHFLLWFSLCSDFLQQHICSQQMRGKCFHVLMSQKWRLCFNWQSSTDEGQQLYQIQECQVFKNPKGSLVSTKLKDVLIYSFHLSPSLQHHRWRLEIHHFFSNTQDVVLLVGLHSFRIQRHQRPNTSCGYKSMYSLVDYIQIFCIHFSVVAGSFRRVSFWHW